MEGGEGLDRGVRSRLAPEVLSGHEAEAAHAPPPWRKRWVGLALAAVLLGLAAWRWRAGRASWHWPLIAGLLATAGTLAPRAMARANQLLVMGLVYYGVFTPYAWALRLLGHDPLDRAARPGESYWTAREPDADLDRYRRQF